MYHAASRQGCRRYTEKAPDESDFEALTARLRGADPHAARIFNCHAGRGRTTTGMVIADLLLEKQAGTPHRSLTYNLAVHEDIREQGNYEAGNYKSILELIKAIEQGPRSKDEADAAIDRSAALQNLRRSIAEYRDKSLNAPTPEKQADARARGEDYLRRYFLLISYDAYLQDQAPKGFAVPFAQWMEGHDLHAILDNLELAMGFVPSGDTAYA